MCVCVRVTFFGGDLELWLLKHSAKKPWARMRWYDSNVSFTVNKMNLDMTALEEKALLNVVFLAE